MSPSSSQPLWVGHVQGARRGDASAKEELDSYFTPFVHGILCCYVAHQVATPMVRATLDDAFGKLNDLKDASDFGPWLLDFTRRIAKNVAKKPGATLEVISGAAGTEGLKALSKLRQQPETTRERLVLRLLEGIPGAEIAEVSGQGQSEVRTDLERGFATLIKDLTGQSLSLSGDAYLWSLTGKPHEKLVPLENQLTPLRYDPAAVEGMTVPLVAAIPIPSVPAGRRPTSPEQKRVASDDGGTTTPVGQKLTDESTSVAEASVTSAAPGADERTQHATDLPAAAKENPFDGQPGTVQASDLPAAAAQVPGAPPRRQSGRHRPLEPEPSYPQPLDPLGTDVEPAPTTLRPRTVTEKKIEPDTTAPRGVPVTLLARRDVETTTTPKADPEQSWKTSLYALDEPTKPPTPRPFSLTRGMTPFYIALILFSVFAFVAWINIQGTERGVRRGWNLVPVMVAAENLSEGTVLTEELVSTREVPDQFVTGSVIKPDSTQFVVNQRILVPVQAGDPLLWTEFDSARATERMSRRIKARGRAYTIESRGIISVGGWVRPGDHVDIIISAKDPASHEKVAATTLQNIPILSTGKLTTTTNMGLLKEREKIYDSVSVMVLPEEVDILALMRNNATYRLVLRNDHDYDPFEGGRSGPNTLLEGRRNQALQQKRFETIQMIRKGK